MFSAVALLQHVRKLNTHLPSAKSSDSKITLNPKHSLTLKSLHHIVRNRDCSSGIADARHVNIYVLIMRDETRPIIYTILSRHIKIEVINLPGS